MSQKQNTCKRHISLHLKAATAALSILACADAYAARCLYVSSYHPEYEWNHGIEKGMDPQLEGKCEVKKFYMDTLRNTEPAFAEAKALEAKALIEKYKPDVVIAADDAASKYLVKPYYKDAATPFVFCGVNWTVEAYGYPYSNATGMVEVSPVKPLLQQAMTIRANIKSAVFISADVLTQHKEFDQVSKIFAKEGVQLTPIFAKTFAEWKDAYIGAQKADLVYLSNSAGISDWDEGQAARVAYDNARKVSVTTYEQMMRYSMLGMVKTPEEQGEWAGQVAARILAGVKPKSIPIIANSRWNIYANLKLLDKAKVKLPDPLVHKAVKK